LSTSGLIGIIKYAPDDLYVTVATGTPLAQLQKELVGKGLWIPLISPWPDSTIGGIVATNWNAPLRMRYGYGSVRDQVLAMTVALPDGRVISTGRPVVKNVAGYDMTKLFIGSHGTLGMITDVTLKLSPVPRARMTAALPFDRLEDGLACGAGLLRICQVASALVLCHLYDVPGASAPYVLFITVEGLKEEVNAELEQIHTAIQAEGGAMVLTEDVHSGSEFWADWVRSATSGATLLRLGLAPSELPNWLHIHSTLLQPLPFIADLANGLLYLQAAHGIHELETALLAACVSGGYVVPLNAMADQPAAWRHAPGSLDLMRALKTRWDPHNLLNTGVFFEGT
jgi:D-lactate dehydrogenase (cytochrome)